MRKMSAFLALVLALALPLTALASDWEWTSEPTPGALNVFPSDSNDDDEDDEESFENGDLADTIILSEVMPNPEGTDTDTEWIEIYNTGTDNVDLGNWQLDDEDGGSDPYTFPANIIIEAQDFLVIYRVDSDIALNNDADEVRLSDYEGTLQDSVTYDTSPEGESYARIVLESDNQTASAGFFARASADFSARLIPTAHAAEPVAWDEAPWEWTQTTTAGSLNPIYYFIQGEITEMVPFANQVRLKNDDGPFEVSLAALDLNEELKTSLFAPGNTISGYATLSNNVFELQRFDDATSGFSGSSTDGPNIGLLILFLGLSAGAGWWFIQKNKKTRQNPLARHGLL